MKVLRADIPQQPMGIVAVANDTNSCECLWHKRWVDKDENTVGFMDVSVFSFTFTSLTKLSRAPTPTATVHRPRAGGEFSLCRVDNGGCQDLCLLTSEGRVNCSCRGDRKLLEDNTCIGKRRRFIDS
ncbi:hypothetical protein INR49_020508 [Caranx melampygus]|nr:hypothetical protein INR49_020508 [Caranx melampygus]